MKSNAPWSVKGIERDARETAKDAAKREGMTVGEWLNQMIYTAGEPQSSGGEVEGLQLRDIVTAIEHLNKNVAEANKNNADATAELTRKIGDVVERTQRLERVKPSEGTYDDLAGRLTKLEEKTGDRSRVDALKALEKAVAQVAVQFSNAQKTSMERLDASEQQLQELAARIDNAGGETADASGVNFLKDAIDGLSVRITRTERLAKEAANQSAQAGGSAPDQEFIESTDNRLRILGEEIKRGGDQARSLETTIDKLSQQIDASERRSAEGIQLVADTIAEMRDQFASGDDASRATIDAAVAVATQEADERIDALQKSFDAMMARLDALNFDEKPAPAEENTAMPEEETTALDETVFPEDDAAPKSETTETDFDLADEINQLVDEPEAEAEPQAASEEVKALLQEDDNDIEEDPFAFADEIDAALEAEDNDNDDADFAFELEDDASDENPEDSESKAILSEVQQAFGKKGAAPEPVENDEPAPSSEADLDAILADLDDLTGNADDSKMTAALVKSDLDDETPQENIEAAPTSEQSLTDPAEETVETPPSEEKEDYLKAARRRAKEAAAQREVEAEKPARRKLSPKQKAILAARARQKRKAEMAAPVAEKPSEKTVAAKDALRDAGDAPQHDHTEEDDDEPGFFAKLKSKLPFVGGEKGTDDDETLATPELQIDTSEPSTRNGDRAAFETLKSTASARPLTLALALGIVLAAVVLFLVVKDLVFKSPEATTVQRPAITGTGAVETTPDFDTAAPAVEPAPAIDPVAVYAEAMTLLNGPENETAATEALDKLEQAAALGHPPAQLQLGELYKTGQGVDTDAEQARIWFRRAANGGNVLAMHRIGVMTARGDGGPADTSEAIGWFELAANHGLVDSQYNLGAIFHPSGDGSNATIQDAGKAYYWYSLAAKNGDEQATPLAAGLAGALTNAQKQDIDNSVANWEAAPADPLANEMAAP